MEGKCKVCGEYYTLDKEQQELVELGVIALEDVGNCDYCLEGFGCHYGMDYNDYPDFSDADPGL